MELSRKQAAIFSWKATGWEKGEFFTIYFRHDAALADDDWEETADGDGQLGEVTGGGTVQLVEDEYPVCLFGARALKQRL